MVQVRKLERVAQEEDRSIVAYKVPVSCFCVEFHCKSPDVTFRVSCSALSGHCREAHEAWGLLADFGEYGCAGISGDVMCDREGPVCSCSFRMHAPFGDDLSVEMGHLFKKPCVL